MNFAFTAGITENTDGFSIHVYPYLSVFIHDYLCLSMFIYVYLCLSMFIYIYTFSSIFISIYLYLSVFIRVHLWFLGNPYQIASNHQFKHLFESATSTFNNNRYI